MLASPNNFILRMVLNANPHGHDKVINDGEYCLRTAPDGTDLNRNYDDHWEKNEAEETNSGIIYLSQSCAFLSSVSCSTVCYIKKDAMTGCLSPALAS